MMETEKRPEDLSGLDVPAAREYILQHISTLKLTEKQILEMDGDISRWKGRVDLARSQGASDLAREAAAEAERLEAKKSALSQEAADLKALIEKMRLQLPVLAARERSVDPDLLEQELLIMAGRLPGDGEKAALERNFAEMEKQAAADTALEALKAKMAMNSGAGEKGNQGPDSPGPKAE
jgi:phage shock protein A